MISYRCRGTTLWWFTLLSVLVFCGGLALSVSASAPAGKKWQVGTPPRFVEAAINVGGQVPLGPGQTIIVIEKTSATLTAITEDMDKYTDATGTHTAADTPYVIWSATAGATVSVERTESEKPVTLKLGAIPKGQSFVVCTVKAQPDDIWTGKQTGTIPPDEPTRNDDPGPTTVTLRVVVIKAKDAPTMIAEVDTCIPTFRTLFELWLIGGKQPRTAGVSYRQMKVSGGNLPGAYTDWNGFLVGEDVQLDKVNPGTGKRTDFSTYPGDITLGTTTAFVVGYTNLPKFGCRLSASDNCFWDTLGMNAKDQWLLGDAKAAPKTVRWIHRYYVNTGAGQQFLKNGMSTNSWINTLTFKNIDYIPTNTTESQVNTTVTVTREIPPLR